MAFLTSLFGDANKRFLQTLATIVSDVNSKEQDLAKLSDEDLRSRTLELKKKLSDSHAASTDQLSAIENSLRLAASEDEKNRLHRARIELLNAPLNELAPDSFAIVREAAKRTLNQRHFDVQLMGGLVLHYGQVAEMKTGEGKTLTSTLAVYLNALSGKGVHVVTVNDYLARRDAIWMAQIFHLLGLSVGVIMHDAAFLYDPMHVSAEEEERRDEGVALEMKFLRPVSRKEAYQADITYGTNNEFGFDYLRDNMVYEMTQKVQRDLHYAIVDEVDSILIDEARTPLIISASDTRPTQRYYQFAELVNQLDEKTDYAIDEKLRAATLTESGITKLEKLLNVENIYVQGGIQTVHHIEQALKAKTLFLKDRDYTIKDGEIVIVDEFTGRMLPGRRYSEGLHQAIEAKEGVTIQRESKTMATITFQNYFRLYTKLSGMTGTAETEAEELAKIYNLDVTTIPTHRPMIRQDNSDRIYKNEAAKFAAVVQEIKTRHEKGQPILVGTISIDKNERLSALLEQEGLQFHILNAKQHEREAEIIAQAGAYGAITIATNMAGRGVDIKLGGSPHNEEQFKRIVELGGLHVLGTERHESRRIDNQLRGRSGRQGEPGSSQFLVSLEDDLMRIFGAERVKGLMKNWPDDMPIENKFISKSIESAQKRVEGHNFDIRKHLVEYDDVINKQRMIVYGKRDLLLQTDLDNEELLPAMLRDEMQQEIEYALDSFATAPATAEWSTKELVEFLRALLNPTPPQLKELEDLCTSADAHAARAQLFEKIQALSDLRFGTVRSTVNKQMASPTKKYPINEIIRSFYLRSIDILWVEHLETINYLRTGIGLRGYGQRDPLVEYKRESKDLFNRLLADIRRQFVFALINIGTEATGRPAATDGQERLTEQKDAVSVFGGAEERKTEAPTSKPKDTSGKKIGRNDPCYCGAINPDTGQVYKYKKCGLINAPYHKQ
ncbi:MAG: preprotein translocase subunit SecA [Candidatus Komeilibacteria bacterium RIFCSPLOWO2_01_FULL_52_15]|uniref:Protein translocase subunit SecA n=2 Tax=Candidatus Komeiliibacteriota TaxID=1817908 RepID=A0A1G2BQW9_9BACT|nr:MAG: preprotein translocase subunit SecA [Candidatus Komeilibacteria bacterium RIFCSPHIGHO2_01_FULL_52_14]OGY91555.1 MAG: preprotein translocase subunit SecA [Candidatus Komeilibacteria bacterium RIFCSPLOWO2_01_FULL_52_15]